MTTALDCWIWPMRPSWQAIGEAGGNVAGGRVGGQVARRNAGQKEEDEKASGQDQQHERGRDGEQAVSHAAAWEVGPRGVRARWLASCATECRISINTKVMTATSRNAAKANTKTLPTVSTAEASTMRNESTASM